MINSQLLLHFKEGSNKSLQRKRKMPNVNKRNEKLDSDFGSYNRKFNNEKYTYKDVLENTKTKKDCIDWLMCNNVLQNGFKCEVCGSDMKLVPNSSQRASSDVYIWECKKQIEKRRHYCRKSIRKNSFFEGSNLQLEEIINVIYFWSKGISQSFLKEELCLQNDAVVNVEKKCREICQSIIMLKSEMIGGEGIDVEIDESKIGKRKYNRGKHVEGQWIFGGCETNNSNRMFLVTRSR